MTFGGYGVLFVMEWAISVTNDASGAGFVTKQSISVTIAHIKQHPETLRTA